MQEKVLVYSRFPKALMQRIGERFELLDAAGKPPREVFSADQLSGVRAMRRVGREYLRTGGSRSGAKTDEPEGRKSPVF